MQHICIAVSNKVADLQIGALTRNPTCSRSTGRNSVVRHHQYFLPHEPAGSLLCTQPAQP